MVHAWLGSKLLNHLLLFRGICGGGLGEGGRGRRLWDRTWGRGGGRVLEGILQRNIINRVNKKIKNWSLNYCDSTFLWMWVFTASSVQNDMQFSLLLIGPMLRNTCDIFLINIEYSEIHSLKLVFYAQLKAHWLCSCNSYNFAMSTECLFVYYH